MKYTKTHEWVMQEGKTATVGITAYAREEIGELAYVEFPKIGSLIKAGDDACVIESTKAAVVVHAPVSGKIVAINDHLRESIQALNEDPEKEGWLFRVELTVPQEIEELLSRLDYAQLIRKKNS